MNSQVWAHIAAHAAKVAAHLKEIEGIGSREKDSQMQSLPFSFQSTPTLVSGTQPFNACANISSTPPLSFVPNIEAHLSQHRLAESKNASRPGSDDLKKSKQRTGTKINSSIQSSISASKVQSKNVLNNSRIDRIRRYDREKKRKARSTCVELVSKLDHILRPPGRGAGARTLHETLAATIAAVQSAVGSSTLRSGMLSERGAGMLLVDAESLTVVEGNAAIAARIGVPEAAIRNAPLSAILFAEDAADTALVLRHLVRGRFRDPSLRRFNLGLRLAAPAGVPAHEVGGLPTEIVRCCGGRPGERELFMLFFSPLADPAGRAAHAAVAPLAAPANHAELIVKALCSVAGFRDGETAVLYRLDVYSCIIMI